MRSLLLSAAVLCLLRPIAQSDELLFYAPFDGAADAAMARGDARCQGGLGLQFVPGLRGQAVALRDDCRYAVSGNFRPEEGTVAVWVRPHWAGNNPADHYVFCLYGQRDLPHSWAVNRFNLCFGGGRCVFAIFTKTENVTFNAGAPVTDWRAEDWHHVAVTWMGVNSGKANAEMRLYLDGVLVGSVKDKQIDVGPTDSVMAIGRDQDASPDYGDADFDDLFLYGRALNENEIADAVAAIRKGDRYDRPAEVRAGRRANGWWQTAWPFRAEVILPPSENARRDVFMQCPLRLGTDLSALGINGSVNGNSVRTVEEGKVPTPARVEDQLVEWQAPGVTPAGMTRKFYIYFQTNKYAIVRPLMAVCEITEGQLPPPPPAAPDYATTAYGKPWNFDDGAFSGIDQWGNKPEYVRNRKVVNGILSMDVSTDPWFIWGDMWGQVDKLHQKVAIDLDKFPILEMKIRQSIGSATWELYGRPGTSEQLLHYEFPVTGAGWQRIRIDLKKDARWSGVLSAFRIDPTNGVDAHIEIDWVRLISVTPLEHGRVETLGERNGIPARLELKIPKTIVTAGVAQDIVLTAKDAAGKPVSHQPVKVELASPSGGEFVECEQQKSLALNEQARRGLTDDGGRLILRYAANQKARAAADVIKAHVEFAEAPEAKVVINTVAGRPHHYLVQPAKVVVRRSGQLPLSLTAQLVDQYDNPIREVRRIAWETDESGTMSNAATILGADGQARASWRGDEAKRWVYHVRVRDEQGLTGESAAICLLPSQPRKDPIVLGPNGYFREGQGGPAWLPLGGFYANWVGLPEGGEEGMKLISFVDATEEQLDHWLRFLSSQGVTAMRFMLRAHTPWGMEPMDIVGRVNRPLFAKVLRYLDLARKYDIRFMLTLHEDYTKPAYYDRQSLETFCIPRHKDENLDKLPPYQRRFVRDRKLIGLIDEKYTDPDVIACQDQYARAIVGLLKDNPQLFAWEFENEMVDCPREWANHMAAVIRSVDPVTPICASHGGGGLNTADPLWWTRKTDITFYTYHLYGYVGTGSTSEQIDYGGAVDLLTGYGRMAGKCMLGESSGDEFSYYPKDRDADRRYLMRDIIWFSLVNGNPGCFFWNSRGFEVEQFKLANKIISGIDWRAWRRQKPEVGILVTHPLNDDKYYRSQEGAADYAMMCRYAQRYLSRGMDFDFTTEPDGYAKTATLQTIAPPETTARVIVSEGFQVRANAREGYVQGIAYVRNFAGIWRWQAEHANMWLRRRKPAPLVARFNFPIKTIQVVATDLDTGKETTFELAGQGQIDLGQNDHDWAIVWRSGS